MRQDRKSEFRLEDELLPVLTSAARNGGLGLDSRNVIALEKLQVGNVIPDVVVLACEHELPTSDAKARRLSYFECSVIALLLAKGTCSSLEVAIELFSQQDVVDLAVERLAALGLLHQTAGLYSVAPRVLPRAVVVSVEAKLLRWSQAIQQAKAYLSFSNASFVALPQSVVQKNSKIAEHCIAAGVGLIAVSRSEAVVSVPAHFQEPASSEWVCVVEKATGFSSNKMSTYYI